MNYYEVLKVSRQASHDEMKKAYRKHVKECHPDRVHNLDIDIQKMAQEKVLKYNEAYHTLSKPDSRAEYDKSLLEEEKAGKFVEEREKFTQEEKKDGQSKRETHEKRSIVTEAFLKTVEEKIKSQNEAVKWSRGNSKNFNLTLEGHKRIEEYRIYFKVFAQLGEKDLKSVIHQMRSLDIKPTKLWSTRFTTICLVTEDFNNLGAIKEMVKKYNLQQQEPGARHKKGKSIITLLDMTTRKVFSPFSEKFKPHLQNI